MAFVQAIVRAYAKAMSADRAGKGTNPARTD
jgi:hypothetical protein